MLVAFYSALIANYAAYEHDIFFTLLFVVSSAAAAFTADQG